MKIEEIIKTMPQYSTEILRYLYSELDEEHKDVSEITSKDIAKSFGVHVLKINANLKWLKNHGIIRTYRHVNPVSRSEYRTIHIMATGWKVCKIKFKKVEKPVNSSPVSEITDIKTGLTLNQVEQKLVNSITDEEKSELKKAKKRIKTRMSKEAKKKELKA